MINRLPVPPDDRTMRAHAGAGSDRADWAHLRPVPSAAISAYPLDDEIVVYDPASGQAFVLNETAALIWDLCDGSHDVEALVHEVMAVYGVSGADALSDVYALLTDFRGAGLIVFSP